MIEDIEIAEFPTAESVVRELVERNGLILDCSVWLGEYVVAVSSRDRVLARAKDRSIEKAFEKVSFDLRQALNVKPGHRLTEAKIA